MSQVKQVGLLAAGCQPWNKDVCAASGDRFAYCATLAIYIYQLDHRYNEFKLRAIMAEHKKTITAISWCPHNPDVFASASADSLVIIWNVTEQKVVAKLDNTKGSRNQKHVLRPESLEGTDEEDPVTALEWDPLSTDYLLVANLHNGIRLVDSESLSCITTFNFPSAAASVQCLAWVSSAPGMFVTGGDLNCIAGATSRNGGFIWDVLKGKMITRFSEYYVVIGFSIIRTIDGRVLHKYKHPAAVFGCDWSQNNKDMIATGCEDKNVRVYYLATNSDQPLKVFTGHTAKVFHVRWSPLREGILCSGSDDGWDYTIRVWDTRDGTCLDTVYDHGADVYGLTCHPSRPFTMASCSRDSTVRLWSLTPLINPVQINILADRCWDEIIGNTDRAVESGVPPLLCGKVSRDIKQELEKLSGNPREKKLRWFSECFSSKAQELTTVKMSKFGGGIGAPSKEERLKEAAEIHLRLGQIQRYCELMVELGEWDKALSVAPGVSMNYWRKLMQRRADQLIQEENDDVIPYCIAIGDVKKLVSFFTSRGQLKEALLVAQAACEGNIQMSTLSTTSGSSNSGGNNTDDYNELLHNVSKELAEWYFQDGHAVLAACCHLAVENIELAMANLIRGNELELAISVGTVLGESAAQATHYALELLARKCMTVTTWDLAADLLMMIPDNKLQLVKLCAFYPGCIAEINDLHEKCNLPDVEECMRLAETSQADGDIFETIKYYLLSTEPEKALPIGIQYVKGRFRNELLIFCGYIGALLAIRRQYNSIVPALYEYTRPTDESPCTPPSELHRTVYSILESRMQEEPLKGMVGPDYVTGSNLPSHSDVHISCLTGLRIQGPVFFLEDGKSAISLNDALMWAKVNPFSPLGTGIRLNPF
ncbi:Wdr17 [Columba guinea]|nr:Wdr17 [Columba guinea]